MPTPIQSSSVTAKLRSFFRLRGRQIFTLDETVVPTAQVEDLTAAPYRANHQVRFKMGTRIAVDSVPTRGHFIIINTSPLGLASVSLAPVAGVAVIEEIELRQEVVIAPGGAQNLIISLVSHQGLLASLDFIGQQVEAATNVDNAVNTGAAAGEIIGQAPINLVGAAEALLFVIGDLGATLQLGSLTLPTFATGITTRLLPAQQVTIGDNVALLIHSAAAATAGRLGINVSGTYYPLARS